MARVDVFPDDTEWYYDDSSPWSDLFRADFKSRLKSGDPEAVRIALRFAAVDPFFMGSGYLKGEFFPILVRRRLSDREREELSEGVLVAVKEHRGVGWCHYCLLAASFADAAFMDEVRKIRSQSEGAVKRRAEHLLLRCLFPGARPHRARRYC